MSSPEKGPIVVSLAGPLRSILIPESLGFEIHVSWAGR